MSASFLRPRPLLTAAAVLLLGLTVTYLVGRHRAGPSPAAAFDVAREALAAARRADAATYAPQAYAAAEAAWDSALTTWRAENERFLLQRRNARPAQAAALAQTAAAAAHRSALATRDSLHAVALTEGSAARDLLHRYRTDLHRLPPTPAWRAAVRDAQTWLAQSEAALARQDYRTAADQAHAAATALRTTDEAVQTTLDQYLANVPLWRQWTDETLRQAARTGSLAIIVDKMAHQLHVYRGSRHLHSYTVDLGPRWMGPKRVEGDLATPEGRYRVQRKLGAGATRYHRALVIDYPNAEDRRRFEAARREGRLAPGQRIGGLIEIHGDGGRGASWTEGCVALSNPDMEALFRLIPVGTPVTIVGALTQPHLFGAARSAPSTPAPSGR